MFEVKYDTQGNVISSAPSFQEAPVISEKPQPETTTEESVQIGNSITDLEQNDAIHEPEQSSEPVQEVQETNRERNTRALRELKEKAEKERDEAIRRARDLEERYSKPQQKVDNDDVDFNIGEDDLVEGKHVKPLLKEIKNLKKEIEASRNHYKVQSLQDRLRYEYPDFDKVVNAENIELLKHLKPRQAQLLDSSTDMYATAASAYEMIKEYGIYQDPVKQSSSRDRELVQKNIAKPRPVNSLSPQRGDSPLSKANEFSNGWSRDSDVAKAYHKEMIEAMRNR